MAKNALTESFDGLPGWAWPLVALCFFIPVATLGGAIPVLLGLGGGMGVATLARHSGRSTSARVALTNHEHIGGSQLNSGSTDLRRERTGHARVATVHSGRLETTR